MPRFAMLRLKGLITVLSVAIGVVALVGAQSPKIDPTDLDRATSRLVAELLQRGHLSKPEIDDEVSKEWFKLFLKKLDRQKLYFTKDDIEEFKAFETELDDQIDRGDLQFATLVFDRFLQRQTERLELIRELLDDGLDLTEDETYIDDADKLDYPADEEEARDRWRKELKYELLVRKTTDVEEEKAISQLRTRFEDHHRFYHRFNTNDLLQEYLTALAEAIDPHSSYMGPQMLEDMMKQQLQLSLEGIGASLGIEGGLPTVNEVIPGGAADKDGRLEPEDKIIGVEEEDGEIIDFAEMRLSDVVRVIRGPRGTKVRLIVQPANTKERKVYEITREKIELADQRAKGEIIEGTDADGKPVKIGVINLPSFYGDTAAVRRGDEDAVSATADCQKLLKDFQKQGVDAVLLDMRRNGGGLLLEAISLSGLFINSGPVVRVKDAEGTLPYDDEDEGTAYDGPLAILISHYSASASEIFAGVIKDYGRGLVIGDSSTYGKGTVQSIIDLNQWVKIPGGNDFDLGALKLTIQQFYRANGESTQVRGVRSDVHIPSFSDHLEYLGESKMDNALPFDKIEPLTHDFYNLVPAELVAQVESRSVQRRKDNPKFQRQARAIQKMLDRRSRNEISLNEEKFREEFVSAEDEEEEEEKLKRDATPHGRQNNGAWNRDSFYNEEVIAIVSDYVSLGTKALVFEGGLAREVAANP